MPLDGKFLGTLLLCLFGLAEFAMAAFGLPSTDVPVASVTDPVLQERAEALTQGMQGAFIIAKERRVLAARGSGLAN